jgi:hypothetical protein
VREKEIEADLIVRRAVANGFDVKIFRLVHPMKGLHKVRKLAHVSHQQQNKRGCRILEKKNNNK